jgi:hypothetical protein
MKTLEEARAYAKQERSVETQEIWEAILAIHKALVLMGSAGLPERIVSIAGANLVRSGAVESGDFTDEQLSSMATADGVRVWEANMGMIFKDEPVIGPDQELYICQQQHQAQAGWAPGSEGGRTLFRLLRKEPEEPGTYLEFAWGENVPYGAVRRDPIDGKLYTPIKEAGVTLYEPHYPHLVPSEYKLYEDGGEIPEPEPSSAPDWNDLEANHPFAVGDHFTYNGTEYEVLRVFSKLDHWAPPALLNDYYKAV